MRAYVYVSVCLRVLVRSCANVGGCVHVCVCACFETCVCTSVCVYERE